jgi:tRNA(Ile)-lysidine synthase
MFASRTFLIHFHEYSRRRRLISDQSKIIVAVSGGIDSAVLLHLLAKERDTLGLSLIVAHFNHKLRNSESDADEQFVVDRARQYGLEIYIDRANTAECARHTRLGIQEAARNLRYEFFSKLLESSGFDSIATAHNADDNSETILLNLIRGAGVQGLSGIPAFRQDKRVIRPLLFARREEIEAYAAAEQVQFRTDSSNEKEMYTRNYLRHQILPLIRDQINPNIAATLLRTSELFRELEGYLLHTARTAMDMIAIEAGNAGVTLAIPRLKCHPTLIQQYVIMLAAQRVAGRRPEYEQVGKILELTEGLTGSWVMLSEQHGVYRDRDALVFRSMEAPADFEITVLQNHRYDLNDFRFSSEPAEGNGWHFQPDTSVEYVDADQIPPGHLILRTWSDGDWFVPLGMKARKKISDFFVDAKIPLYEKRKFPILATKDGTIIWVCGQRIDDRFKVTDQTLRVLKLEFHRTPEGKDNLGQRGTI